MDGKLGARLKAERKALGLTQHVLSAAGGVATNAQVQYEGGHRWPKSDYLMAIRSVGVDTHYVLTGERAIVHVDIAEQEMAIINCYRGLSLVDKEAIAQIMLSLSDGRARPVRALGLGPMPFSLSDDNAPTPDCPKTPPAPAIAASPMDAI